MRKTIPYFKRPAVHLRHLAAVSGALIYYLVLANPQAALSQGAPPFTLRIGLTSVTLEKEVDLHKKLASFIQKRVGITTELIYRRSYQEMSALLENNGVDIAFVCGLPYVIDHGKFGLELLAAPIFRGKPLYQSYLIVASNSQARALKDLKGKIFSFSDPLSNSGFLVPVMNLAQMNQTPESFFRSYFFTYSHADSIVAVADGLADAANVDSYVWETVKLLNPGLTSKTKVIAKSGHMPIPPVVVRPALPESLKRRLRDILLSIDKHDDGKEILKNLLVDRFEAVKDEHYDSIRENRKSLVNVNVAVKK